MNDVGTLIARVQAITALEEDAITDTVHLVLDEILRHVHENDGAVLGYRRQAVVPEGGELAAVISDPAQDLDSFIVSGRVVLLREFANWPEDGGPQPAALDVLVDVIDLWLKSEESVPDAAMLWMPAGVEAAEHDEAELARLARRSVVVPVRAGSSLYEVFDRPDPEAEIQRPPSGGNYWIWVSQPQYVDSPFGGLRDELDPRNRLAPGSWWTCHPDTARGDLALIYRSHDRRGLVALVQAMSDAYPLRGDEMAEARRWAYGCDWQSLATAEPYVPLDVLRSDPKLEDLAALRASFQQKAYRVADHHWGHLMALLGLEAAKFVRAAGVGSGPSAAAPVALEEQVHDWLEQNIEVLRRHGLPVVDVVARERPLRMVNGRLDLLCQLEGDQGVLVVEVKAPGVRATRTNIGQILSYMTAVEIEDHVQAQGLFVAGSFDAAFESAAERVAGFHYLTVEQLGFTAPVAG